MRGEFVDLDGVRLYCHAAGTRGRGAPLVLLHGAFTSSHLWEEVVPHLPDGHRILLVDLAGHGRSDAPASHTPTVAEHAALVGALLSVFGVEGATCVGHELGGAVALRLVREHPTRVSRAVAVAPAFMGSPPAARRLPPHLRRLAWLRPLFMRLPPGWLASALHAALLPGFVDRSQGARTLDQHLLPFRTTAGRRAAAAQLAALATASPDAAPSGIPLSLVVGADDRWGRRVAAAVARDRRAAGAPPMPVEVVPGVGAMLPHEAPDTLAALVARALTAGDHTAASG
ncbi:MAG: alpha/beta fold hydrolase [Gemmatimonadetes bacterium]|nr:alpha/beta fold hydrolase [Gemmatimonadota bacterium]